MAEQESMLLCSEILSYNSWKSKNSKIKIKPLKMKQCSDFNKNMISNIPKIAENYNFKRKTKATNFDSTSKNTDSRSENLINNNQSNNISGLTSNKCSTTIIQNKKEAALDKFPVRKYLNCYVNKNISTLAIVVLIGMFLNLNLCCGFVLDGTQNSYAQFRKWYSGLNGTLELELKTEQPNGLVLYTDDGGTYDFFELKLVEGSLRLRYNLGGGAQIITVGRDLHDSHWHKVQVSF